MQVLSNRAVRRAGASLVGLAGLAMLAMPSAGADTSTAVGIFSTLPGGTSLGLQISGAAVVQRSTGGTSGMVAVRGLVPSLVYAVHLHKEACSFPGNPGGGHYQNVPGEAAAPPNELWFSSTSDPTAGVTAYPNGAGVGRGSVPWVARPEARSVVIHQVVGGSTAGGPKIACADLH